MSLFYRQTVMFYCELGSFWDLSMMLEPILACRICTERMCERVASYIMLF